MRGHLSSQVLVSWGAGVGERSLDHAGIEPKDVVDRLFGARRPAMCEDVAADLTQRGLEEHERPVFQRAAGRAAQALHRLVQDVEPLFEVDEAGAEFKGLTPHRLKSQ